MQSCYKAASMGGFIGEIENYSCIGLGACFEAASYEGGINRIESSCDGNRACFFLAKGSYISEIVDSCNADKACYSTGWYDGYMQEIIDSCNADSACQALRILEEEEEEDAGGGRKLQRPDNAGRGKKKNGCPPHKPGCPQLTPDDSKCLESCCNEAHSCQGDHSMEDLEGDGCSASCATPQNNNNRDAATERSFLYPWVE